MARRRVVLISVVLAFLFVQLASSEDRRDACRDAMNTLNDNMAICTHTANYPRIIMICEDPCLDYYEALFDNCAPEVCKLASYAFLMLKHACMYDCG